MADPSPSPDTGGDAGMRPDRGSTTVYPGTPRWVKVSGIVALVLVLLVLIAMATGMFAGGDGHGPGRHLPSGGADGHTPPLAHGVPRP